MECHPRPPVVVSGLMYTGRMTSQRTDAAPGYDFEVVQGAIRSAGEVVPRRTVDRDSCGLFHSGHHPHPVQWSVSQRNPVRDATARATGGGWVELLFADGEQDRVWCHDENRLATLLEVDAGRVGVREPNLLTEPGGHGMQLSVAHEASTCRRADDVDLGGSVIDRLREVGGTLDAAPRDATGAA